MYELVNTSVPNGLIPGTHGFATVAMTKGMPDVIRTRVENYCAYPHRTSAHDGSYFTDNPVNWFHLTLPNEGHVIGRTAPSDFDYTGRTNRLARTIVFKSGEMPAAGGVAALRIAGSHLIEKWSGEPRMLQPDKALAAKFFAADRGTDPRPQNWIALFGERGEELARRTAIFVAHNAAGRGKSLYFKTSTKWDADGTKLLGLFGDLIALMPDNIAPLVAFSTFSPCVPGGTVCHLRGIYDKDNAFELASATQPWIDCENGRIVHEEMLPVESAPSETKTAGGDGITVGSPAATRAAASRIGLTVDPEQLKRQAEKNLADRWGGALSSRNEDSDKAFYWILGALGAIVLCAAVGCWLWVGQSTKSSSNEADEISKMMQADQEAEKERVAQLERDKAEREELERNNKAEEAKRMLAERAEKEIEAADKEAEAIKAAAQKEREEAVRKQNEETRQAEEEMANAREENLKVPLDKLKITKVIDKTQMEGVRNFEIVEGKKPDAERYLLAEYAALVTNENSVVVYYAENGKVNSVQCHYASNPLRAFGNSKPKTKYSLEGWPEKSKDSPWVVVRVINQEFRKGYGERSLAVSWCWNEVREEHLFAQSDSADLKKICFGSDEAKALYKMQGGGKVYYMLSWDDDNDVYIHEGDAIQMMQFCDDKELQRLIADYDNRITGVTAKIKAKENKKDEVESVLAAINNGRTQIDKIEKGEGFGNDKLTKSDKKQKQSREKDKIVKAIQSFDRKKYANLQATGIDGVERNLKDMPERLTAEIEKLKAEKERLEREN